MLDQSRIIDRGARYCVIVAPGERKSSFGNADSKELFDTLVYTQEPDQYKILGFYGEPYNSQPFVHQAFDNEADAREVLMLIELSTERRRD